MFEKIFNCPIISIFFINILITLENFRKTKIFRSDDLFFIHSYSFVFLKFSQIFFIFCFFPLLCGRHEIFLSPSFPLALSLAGIIRRIRRRALCRCALFNCLFLLMFPAISYFVDIFPRARRKPVRQQCLSEVSEITVFGAVGRQKNPG